MPGTRRNLFVAVPVPNATATALRDAMANHRIPGLRLDDPAKSHVTIVFAAATTAAQRAAFSTELTVVAEAVPPFHVSYRGLTTFRRARVAVALVEEGVEAMSRLRSACFDSAIRFGMRIPAHPGVDQRRMENAHTTIGRWPVKTAPRSIPDRIEEAWAHDGFDTDRLLVIGSAAGTWTVEVEIRLSGQRPA